MNKPEFEHAFRYATEATKVYLMQEYKQKFPQYFQNAILETRPATDEDYFVPPSIADKCIVVVKTQFDEIGCKRFGCFPFKEKWQNCNENDPVQWVRIGGGYKLGCQPSCKDHSIDTDWSSDGRCVLSNPLKKAFASMPENIFQRSSRHVFHGGFDIVDGQLKINKRYCEAYGLNYVNEDCVASGEQKFGEWLLGTTTVRAMIVANLKPLSDRPPPIPDYMNYVVKRKRVKKSHSFQREPMVNPNLFHEIAVELTKDLSRDISEYAIENYLKRKAPRLLSRALDNVSAKIVLKNSVVFGMKKLGTFSLKALGSTVGVVTTLYGIYELINGVLDSLDPYDYLKVIDKKMLEKINDELDYTFYQDGPVRPEITPEYVWESEILGNDQDNENRLNFMITKMEEYLKALENIPPNENRPQEIKKITTRLVWTEKKDDWNGALFKCIVFAMIFLTLMYVNLIHVWACFLFFAMLFYNSY